MILDLPDTVWQLPLDQPAVAVREYAAIASQLRGARGTVAAMEAAATEAVDSALDAGAVLLAVVAPPDAAPAVLTAVPLDAGSSAFTEPGAWDVEGLRDSVEDVGGPDVRETMVLDTGLGPAVVAQRVPGIEQARARRPLALQLQAFIPVGDQLLLLTLACASAHGWDAHQLLFCQVVRSARAEPVPQDEESFENHTYRL